MLSPEQYRSAERNYDEFGRARGPGFLHETGRASTAGRMFQGERGVRAAIDMLDRDMSDVVRMHRSAPSNEVAEESDKAWCDLKVAQCHLMLVARFEREAGDWRLEANRLAALPGGMARAERARAQANRLATMALRHRDAATARQDKGQKEAAELRKKMPQRPSGNGGGGRPGGGGGGQRPSGGGQRPQQAAPAHAPRSAARHDTPAATPTPAAPFTAGES